MPKIHLVDSMLFVNAGMRFPACHANAMLLDTDKGSWETTPKFKEVTCQKCKNIIRKKGGFVK
jgi:hypothetical protein